MKTIEKLLLTYVAFGLLLAGTLVFKSAVAFVENTARDAVSTPLVVECNVNTAC